MVDFRPVYNIFATCKMDGENSNFSCDMVIALYKEDLDWLKNYDYDFRNIFLYNKNQENNNKTSQDLKCTMKGKECVKINLINEGRCDHTFLYHIVHHYDELADVTIFTKGSSDLHRERKKLDFITKKVFETKDSVFSVDRTSVPIEIHLKDFSMSHWHSSHPNNKDSGIMGVFSRKLEPADPRPFGKWYSKYFPNTRVYYISYAAVMAISKAHIHQHPKSYYEAFLKQLEGSSNPEVGHYFERAWIAVFDPIPENCLYVGGGFTQNGGRRRRQYRTRRRLIRRQTRRLKRN